MTSSTLAVHGTCVCWQQRGVLLEGPAGSGKSDLALRLVDDGALLVADDLVLLERRDERLVARAAGLPGHLAIRGQGIYLVPAAAETTLELAVRLAHGQGPRLPPAASRRLLQIELPLVELDPSSASAAARIRLALCRRRVA